MINPVPRISRMATRPLVVGCGSLLVLFSIALMFVSRARELAGMGSPCAANVKGIAASMLIYASENHGALPLGRAPETPNDYSVNLGFTIETQDSQKALEAMQSPPLAGDITSPFWILVLSQQVSPKSFLCKSDPSAALSAARVKNSAGYFYAGFQNSGQLSYSLAYPWTKNPDNGQIEPAPWWRQNENPSQPIISDMTPLSGTGHPAQDGIHFGYRIQRNSYPLNPFNHHGQGMNVGFADGHSEWVRELNFHPQDGSIAPSMVPRRDGNTREIK